MDAGVMASVGVGLGMLVLSGANLFYTAYVSRGLDKIGKLEGELKANAEKLIDQKLSLVEQKFLLVDHRLNDTDSRLRSGHGHFSAMDNSIKELAIADRDLKIDVMNAINELKGLVATKDDLQNLREEIRSR